MIPKRKRRKRPIGRPSKYRKKYCEMLIKHMAEGGSFESFGAVIEVGRMTLYAWLEAHDEFESAKDMGEVKGLKFWEDLGKAGAAGTLRRVVKETYVKDSQGNVVYENGRPLMNREYAPSKFESKPYAMTMRNRFRWREDAVNFNISNNYGLKDPSEMTEEEIQRELDKYEKNKKTDKDKKSRKA